MRTFVRKNEAIVALGVIALASVIMTVHVMYGAVSAYQDGQRDGACVALTGTLRCDYSTMIACQDAAGTAPETAFPCAWLPRGELATVIVDHECPAVSLPRARCLEVAPMDLR